MKVLVCGDRHWSDNRKVIERLVKLLPGSEIIQGGAKGADSIAGEVGKALGYKVTEVKAEWGKYGLAAGPIRNKAMLMMKPGLVIAFHSDLAQSKGTRNTVTQAKAMGIPVEVIV